MIKHIIHNVNRFIPFTILLLCVSFLLPSNIAHAAVQYDGGFTDGTIDVGHQVTSGVRYYSSFFTWDGVSSLFPGGNMGIANANDTRFFQIYRDPTSAESCAQMAPGLFKSDGNPINGTVGTGYAVGSTNLCEYPITGSSNAGQNIWIMFVCSSSGCNTNTSNIIGTNSTAGGYLVSGTQAPPYLHGSMAFRTCDSGGCPTTPFPPPPGACDTSYSHICGFTPENGTTVTGPTVNFTLDYAVTQADIDSQLNDVVVTLHNIDQNVLLLGFLSPGDITLYNQVATTSGAIHFATSSPLADGNYRLEAKMQRKFFFDWITIPGDSINQSISKQFIVGTPTFIGNLTQNGFNILNGTLASSTATSSVVLVSHCNPLGTFDMIDCLSGLFIPDASQIQATIVGAQQGILTRMPWGYITRFVTIVGGTGTTTLSTTYTVEVALNTASDTTNISFNPGDMFAGGGALVDSIHSPYDSSVTFRSVFEPIIKLTIGLLVLFQIVHDITGSHAHHSEAGDVGGRRRKRT